MKECAMISSLKNGEQAEFREHPHTVIDAVRLESTFVNNLLHQVPKTNPFHDPVR